MAKSRSFSIFLLKHGVAPENALKDDHPLGNAVSNASGIPDGATLYILDKSPSPPWWRAYWGIPQDLMQVLKGAMVFLPVRDRFYCLTFGHTYHLLKEDSYEYDFGLRTTLNALDPNKIKSTDILQPVSAKRERIQSPTASDLTFFDFSRDDSIIKRLTGSVLDEYAGVLSSITGASSLRISSKVSADEIVNLCETLLGIYNKEDYKDTFPDLHNIVPLKDPDLLLALNGHLIDAFRDESRNLVLAIPELIDHKTPLKISYSGAGRDDSRHDDVFISHYRDYLQRKEVDETSVSTLVSHKLNLHDENGQKIEGYTIFKCLIFDCEHDGSHYHLCEGQWYKVEDDYIARLRSDLDPAFGEYTLLSDCEEKLESAYNNKIAESSDSVYCLDGTSISPPGQRQLEPCDIFTVRDSRAELIHVKISTRSANLSHLFNQGLNSVELLRLETTSKDKLMSLIDRDDLHEPIKQEAFSVVYGIITAKEASKKSDNLPIFSRISLARTIKSFKLMGVPVEVVFIKDKVDRKNSH